MTKQPESVTTMEDAVKDMPFEILLPTPQRQKEYIEHHDWLEAELDRVRQRCEELEAQLEDFRILDMSAGNRAMWFDKNNPIATYLDRRAEVEPSIVCDTREMPPTVGCNYSLVVFDPPHVNFGANAAMSQTYGHHTTEEIRDIIKRSAQEAHRVTKPNALMAFKWNDHDQKLGKVLGLMDKWWEPLFGRLVATRTKHACGTHWVMLRRKEVSDEV